MNRKFFLLPLCGILLNIAVGQILVLASVVIIDSDVCQAETPNKGAKGSAKSNKTSAAKSGKATSSSAKPAASQREKVDIDSKSTTPAEAKDDEAVKKSEPSAIEENFGFNSGDGNAPIFVNSDNLSLESKKRTFTYSGNVKIVQADMNIDADLVVGKYDENNVMKEIVCKGHVVMTRGETLKATANRALYLVAKQSVELTEGPEVTHKGSTLTADKVTVFLKEDRSEAEGNVRVRLVKTEGSSGFDLQGIDNKSAKKK